MSEMICRSFHLRAPRYEGTIVVSLPGHMNVFAPAPSTVSAPDTVSLFRGTFRRQTEKLEKGEATYRVATSQTRYQLQPGRNYHFKPEMFVQLGGATKFTLPETTFTLQPGEICIMLAGVPHGEITYDGARPFENVVVCYYNDTVAIHVARATPARRPFVHDIFFFRTGFYSGLVEYLNRIGELRGREPRVTAAVTRGLLLAEMATLLAVVDEAEVERFSESDRTFRCEWIVRNNIHDPELCVEKLAEHLHCSADRLTRTFRAETGECVSSYIKRMRLQSALELLQKTDMSVKEVAAACGFNDPSYFARAFLKAMGRSPQEFRDDLKRIACEIERDPKVVYSDHVERNFGLPPDVMSRAVVRMLS